MPGPQSKGKETFPTQRANTNSISVISCLVELFTVAETKSDSPLAIKGPDKTQSNDTDPTSPTKGFETRENRTGSCSRLRHLGSTKPSTCTGTRTFFTFEKRIAFDKHASILRKSQISDDGNAHSPVVDTRVAGTRRMQTLLRKLKRKRKSPTRFRRIDLNLPSLLHGNQDLVQLHELVFVIHRCCA